jgi:hypothetical protein
VAQTQTCSPLRCQENNCRANCRGRGHIYRFVSFCQLQAGQAVSKDTCPNWGLLKPRSSFYRNFLQRHAQCFRCSARETRVMLRKGCWVGEETLAHCRTLQAPLKLRLCGRYSVRNDRLIFHVLTPHLWAIQRWITERRLQFYLSKSWTFFIASLQCCVVVLSYGSVRLNYRKWGCARPTLSNSISKHATM